MLKKYLNNRFCVLYLTPLIIGLLTVFSFQPYNIVGINFLILPIFFSLTVFLTFSLSFQKFSPKRTFSKFCNFESILLFSKIPPYILKSALYF